MAAAVRVVGLAAAATYGSVRQPSTRTCLASIGVTGGGESSGDGGGGE